MAEEQRSKKSDWQESSGSVLEVGYTFFQRRI